MATELKRLDFNKDSFEANGKLYLIEKGMNISRLKMYNILEKEATYGMDFEKFFLTHSEIRADLNSMQLFDAIVKLDNLQRGITKIQMGDIAPLRVCALFCNEQHEDRTTISEDIINAKIEDWYEYDVRDFFTLALNGVKGFISAYGSFSHTTSAPTKNKIEELKEKIAAMNGH